MEKAEIYSEFNKTPLQSLEGTDEFIEELRSYYEQSKINQLISEPAGKLGGFLNRRVSESEEGKKFFEKFMEIQDQYLENHPKYNPHPSEEKVDTSELTISTLNEILKLFDQYEKEELEQANIRAFQILTQQVKNKNDLRDNKKIISFLLDQLEMDEQRKLAHLHPIDEVKKLARKSLSYKEKWIHDLLKDGKIKKNRTIPKIADKSLVRLISYFAEQKEAILIEDLPELNEENLEFMKRTGLIKEL